MTTKPDTWFLIADRSRASVYRVERDGLELVHQADEPSVRSQASELVTGDRGRRGDSNGQTGPGIDQRSGMTPQTDPQDAVVSRFVGRLSDWLHGSATRHDFDELVIVAGPQMLGQLRGSLTVPAEQRLTDTLDRVYTKLSPTDLQAALHEHFPSKVTLPARNVPSAARAGNQHRAG